MEGIVASLAVAAALLALVPVADRAARRIVTALDADWRATALGWAEENAAPEALRAAMADLPVQSGPDLSRRLIWGFGAAVSVLSGAALWQGAPDFPATGATALLGFGLLVALLTDLRCHLLPDRVIWPLAALGALLSLSGHGVPPQTALAGALAGGGAFWLLSAGYRALRGRTGLGLGDIKLMALAGLWLGWMPLPWLALIAAVGGIVAQLARGRGAASRMAFGPALILALLLLRLPLS